MEKVTLELTWQEVKHVLASSEFTLQLPLAELEVKFSTPHAKEWVISLQKLLRTKKHIKIEDKRKWSLLSWDTELTLNVKFDNSNRSEFSGRAIFTAANRNTHVSLTFRHQGTKQKKIGESNVYIAFDRKGKPALPFHGITQLKCLKQSISESGKEVKEIYESLVSGKIPPKSPASRWKYLSKAPEWESEHLFSLTELHNFVFDQMQHKDDNSLPQGLLIIAGATKTGKSELARGLIARWMLKARNKESAVGFRCPHLLTVEDPIEKSFFDDAMSIKGNVLGLTNSQHYGIDYTPRMVGIDCASVGHVLHDALRQTPTIVYIGEVRGGDDWSAILDFAATGHLVIATAHASSVTETFSRVFEAVNAKTPAAFCRYAQRICGVVGLRSITSDQSTDVYRTEKSDTPSKVKGQDPKPLLNTIVLPSLWRNTNEAIAKLAGDGLASILPTRIPPSGNPSAVLSGSRGRASCFEALWSRHRCESSVTSRWKYWHKNTSNKFTEYDYQDLSDVWLKKAIAHDLEGA